MSGSNANRCDSHALALRSAMPLLAKLVILRHSFCGCRQTQHAILCNLLGGCLDIAQGEIKHNSNPALNFTICQRHAILQQRDGMSNQQPQIRRATCRAGST